MDLILSACVGILQIKKKFLFTGLSMKQNLFIAPRPILFETKDGVTCNLGFYDLHISIYGDDITKYRLTLTYKYDTVISKYDVDVTACIEDLIKEINDINKSVHRKDIF